MQPVAPSSNSKKETRQYNLSGNDNNNTPSKAMRNYNSGDEISFVDTKYLCVGIVDIVNSTKITADIDDSENVAKYYSIFINTMAVIARSFGGEVIKNIGDSVVFFFPKTSGSPHDKSSFKE